MGSGTFNYRDYEQTSRSATTRFDGSAKSVKETFTQRKILDELNPLGVMLRESVDSIEHPDSNALIFGLDLTGSMGRYAQAILKDSLGELMKRLIDYKIIPDPHIMFMGIGDVYCDSTPLQITQFESDNRIVEQLLKMYVEGGGGGNNTESYDLAWFFASTRTHIDCFNKRGRKGYLFTIGDEMIPNGLKTDDFKKHINSNIRFEERYSKEHPIVKGSQEPMTELNVANELVYHDYSAKELLEMAQERWHVFHLIIEEGNYCRGKLNDVAKDWYKLMGRNAILVDNHQYVTEIITAIIQIKEGANHEDVINSYESETVRNSIRHALYGHDEKDYVK